MTDNLKAKLKNILDKVTGYVKENKVLAISAALVLTVVIAGVLLLALRSGGTKSVDYNWGDGITEGVPAFSDSVNTLSVAEDGSYVAAYYTEVTIAQVEEYINSIESACLVEFRGEQYPKTASFNGKIIAIHYNVTNMQLSVTVVPEYNEKNN